MRATQVDSGTVGIVDRELRAIGLERYVDRGTKMQTAVGCGALIAVENVGLIEVSTTDMEAVEHRIFGTNAKNVAQESVRGEVSGNGELLIPFLEVEIIATTYVEAGGKLHLGSTRFDSEAVASIVDHGQRMARTTKAHGRTPVLEGETELEFVVLASDILDTCIDGKTGARDIGSGLGGKLEDNTTMDGVGEAVGIGHIDVHIARREGAVDTGVRAVVGGDGNVAKAKRHDIDTKNAGLEDTDTETEGVDSGSTAEAVLATIEHSVGIGHLDVIDKGKTGNIVEHGIEATNT